MSIKYVFLSILLAFSSTSGLKFVFGLFKAAEFDRHHRLFLEFCGKHRKSAVPSAMYSGDDDVVEVDNNDGDDNGRNDND